MNEHHCPECGREYDYDDGEDGMSTPDKHWREAIEKLERETERFKYATEQHLGFQKRLERELKESLLSKGVWERVANNYETECVRLKHLIENADHAHDCAYITDLEVGLDDGVKARDCDCFINEALSNE